MSAVAVNPTLWEADMLFCPGCETILKSGGKPPAACPTCWEMGERYIVQLRLNFCDFCLNRLDGGMEPIKSCAQCRDKRAKLAHTS